jgi:hypothetical protein
VSVPTPDAVDEPAAAAGRAGIVYDVMPIPLVPERTTYVEAGPVRFGVELRAIDDALLDTAYATDPDGAAVIDANRPEVVDDGGVSIHVLDGAGVERLRFDCFADDPHYHYIVPERRTQRYVHHDPVAGGDMLAWALDAVEHRLPAMLRAAGAEELADAVAATDLSAPVAELRRTVAGVASPA